jgi:alpha-mannosidase
VPTPGAQCPGKYRFEYTVFPHAGTWIEGRKNSVIQAAYGYNTPLLMVRADTHEGLDLHEMNITRDDPDKVRAIPFPRGGKLPVLVSFFSLDRPELSLSSLHRPTKQIINPAKEVVLRYVNISSKSFIANLRSYLPVQEAWQIDLNEEPVVCLVVIDSHMIEFPVGGYEIVSLLMCMD